MKAFDYNIVTDEKIELKNDLLIVDADGTKYFIDLKEGFITITKSVHSITIVPVVSNSIRIK